MLTGKVNRTSGTLLINGEEGEMHAYRKAVGFVPQDGAYPALPFFIGVCPLFVGALGLLTTAPLNPTAAAADVMMRELTVRENILFSARMRLPAKGWSDKEVGLIDQLIGCLWCGINVCMGGIPNRMCQMCSPFARAPLLCGC